MKSLYEGLSSGDLDDLLIPLLSIDQYESKIDDDAIVVGFYVKDLEPANDLNRFIQKSAIAILDSEVSPAPTPEGFYIVFVEFTRDLEVKKKLKDILNDIKNLVNIQPHDWSFTYYGHKGVFELTDENMDIMFRTVSFEDLKKDLMQESIIDYFKPSILDDVKVKGNTITLIRNKNKLSGYFKEFGTIGQLTESVTNSKINIDSDSLRLSKKWESFLGEGWLASIVDNNIVLANDFDSKMLILTV
jgi:hypothetical protein